MNFRQFREFLLLSRVSVTGSCNVARFSRGIFDNILRVFERIPLQIGVAEFFGGRSSRFDQRLSSLWRRLSISEKRLSIERSIDLSISLSLSLSLATIDAQTKWWRNTRVGDHEPRLIARLSEMVQNAPDPIRKKGENGERRSEKERRISRREREVWYGQGREKQFAKEHRSRWKRC